MEMDNSLQYQLYDVAQQQLAQHNNYRMFQQQQEQLRLQQAQSMGPIGNTMASAQNMGSQFLDSQIQGLYSSFGITPGMQQAFGNYIWNPAKMQAQQTMSLTGALSGAMWGRAPLAMTFEQRDELARALSTNIATTGTTIGGAVANIGGAGLGLLASAKAAARFGIGKVFAVGALGMGAKWAMTSPHLAAFGGPGYSDDIFHPFRVMKEELAEDKAISDLLSRESYRFLSPLAEKNPYTMGLGRQQIHEWSDAIRNWDTKFRMEDKEVFSILKTSIDSNLITGVDDFEQFERKFSDQVDYIKKASKILNKSYEEVTNMIAEFKQAGITPDNFDVKAAELKTYAGLIGKNVDAVKNFVLSATPSLTQGTFLSQETTQDQLLFNSAALNAAYRAAKNSGDTATRDLIENFGGPMQASVAVRQGQQRVLANPSSAYLLSAFYNPEGQNFEFDQERLSNVFQKVQSGEMIAQEVYAMSNMQNWSTDQILRFRSMMNSGLLFLDRKPEETTMMTSIATGAYANRMGLSKEATLSQFFGLDAASARLLGINEEAYQKYGASIKAREIAQSMTILSAAERQVMAEERKRGNYWESKAFMENFVGDFAVGISNSMEDYIASQINRRAGGPPLDVLTHQLSRFDYKFTGEELERSEAIDANKAAVLSVKMRRALEDMSGVEGVDDKLRLADLPSGVLSKAVEEAYERDLISFRSRNYYKTMPAISKLSEKDALAITSVISEKAMEAANAIAMGKTDAKFLGVSAEQLVQGDLESNLLLLGQMSGEYRQNMREEQKKFLDLLGKADNSHEGRVKENVREMLKQGKDAEYIGTYINSTIDWTKRNKQYRAGIEEYIGTEKRKYQDGSYIKKKHDEWQKEESKELRYLVGEGISFTISNREAIKDRVALAAESGDNFRALISRVSKEWSEDPSNLVSAEAIKAFGKAESEFQKDVKELARSDKYTTEGQVASQIRTEYKELLSSVEGLIPEELLIHEFKQHYTGKVSSLVPLLQGRKKAEAKNLLASLEKMDKTQNLDTLPQILSEILLLQKSVMKEGRDGEVTDETRQKLDKADKTTKTFQEALTTYLDSLETTTKDLQERLKTIEQRDASSQNVPIMWLGTNATGNYGTAVNNSQR